ncbi:MAG: Ig-like domain-containing protein, partial [Nannocystaceae bacterium]
MPRSLLKLLVLSFVVLAVFSCRNRRTEPLAPIDPAVTPPAVASDDKGLLIRLSHADPEAGQRSPTPLAESTALSEADTAKVLARLPKLPVESRDEQDFALRKGSLPPPRTGATVLGTFPPAPEDPGATPRAKGPLAVARFAPEGDVPLAPHLSVTFTQPMVPVTSLDALAAKDVPVTLTPTPAEGQWRWVGTRTLMFEPTERFAMATRYEVAVPKGTRSALGTTLAEAQRWSFTTPPPTLDQSFPRDQPAVRQPLVFASFDQRIDPAAVLATTTVTTGRRVEHPLRLATPDEIEADSTVAQLVAQAQDGRWLVFVPSSPLPADAPVTVRLGPKLPSAEGPLTTEQAQSFSFRTYGPMKVTEHRCGWDGQCPPGAAFEVVLSNPIDLKTFDRALVTAQPPIPNLRVEAYGEYLYVTGSTKGRTKYELKLSGELRDVFGQRLGEAETLRFKVTKAPSSLWMQGSGLTVLDPAAKGRLSVFSVNHAALRVRMWAVQPDDWRAYLKATERGGNDPRDFAPPGRKVLDEQVKVRRDPDALVETSLDLGPALGSAGGGSHGHVVVVVEQTDRPKEPWMLQRAQAWVQVTDLGLQAHVDAQRMLVWATDLADGAPVSEAEVELTPVGLKARTDGSGLASLSLPPKGAQLITVRKGDDVAFLPQSIWWWDEAGSWSPQSTEPSLRWYVFDDRGLYRPGETVKIKGWIRSIDPGLGGDVGGLSGKLREVAYVLSDSQGNEVRKGTLSLNTFGAFDASLELPDTMNLGSASLRLSARPSGALSAVEGWHSFRVEEFRRPEYEVSASVSEGPHLVGEHAVATVKAEYFAGGGLANAAVDWTVTSSPGWYQPPGHDRFTFGVSRPWWMFWGGWGPPDPAEQPRTFQLQALTDAAGEHHLRMDFVSVDPARAMSVTAEAVVTDVNRQAWAASTSAVVHPSALYVGLRSDRQFVRAGEDLEIDVIVTDIDGKVRAGVPVVLRSARIEQLQDHGEWVQERLDEQVCERRSGEEAVRCTVPATHGGSYEIEAMVVDDQGRVNRTELSLWVAGGELPSAADATREQVLLIPDREQYEGGQTAKISVSVPWAPADALGTIRRSGKVCEQTQHLEATTTTSEGPLEESMAPA